MIGHRLRAVLVERLRGRQRATQRLLALIRLVPTRSARSRLYRSLSWPLIDDLRPPIRVSTIAGEMVVDTGDIIGRVLAAAGEWEPHVTDAFQRLLRAGDVCIDIGAHVGYYSLLAAKLVGPGGHVYAFEPSPDTYRALESNLERNDAVNVTALNVAAGANEGVGVLYELPGARSGNSSLSPRLLESPHAGTADEYTLVEVEIRAVDSNVSLRNSAVCG